MFLLNKSTKIKYILNIGLKPLCVKVKPVGLPN